MKVLFQNRPRDQWVGGDMMQLDYTRQALKELGQETDFNDQPLFSPAMLLGDYDIVHLWNFSMPWTKYQVWAAKRQGCKLVCSMLYHDTEHFTPYGMQQIMVDNLDAMIFLTKGELNRARRHLTIPDEKVHFIPNGIERHWATTHKKPFNEKDYILTVGRLDGTKGQLETAKACKNLGLTYICVGERLVEEYAVSCEQEGAVILPPRPHKDLIPVYDNAKLFVLASHSEIFPLTVMEAGARALNIVLTDTCEWTNIPQVTWCVYKSVKSIQEAIVKALKKKRNSEFKSILKSMSWEKVGESVLDVYKTL